MSVVLITGANKGLGYAAAAQLVTLGHTVWVGARDPQRGADAAATLRASPVAIDVTDDASVQSAIDTVARAHGHLDVLVNNAGVFDGLIGTDGITGARALADFDTNAVGVVRVTQAALPLLERADHPVIVNVSSALGSFWATTNPDRRQSTRPMIVYAATKAAVSMLTVQYAKALPRFRVNAVEPGFADTALHGLGAGQTPAEAATVITRLAIIGPDGPTGTFQEHDGELPW